MGHLAYYRSLEHAGEIKLIHSRGDLDNMAELWLAIDEDSADSTPVGVILSMESADPILGPDQVEEWRLWGLRSVSLTHFGVNTWGHGSGTEGGLFAPAFPLMDALKAAKIAVDVSHLADTAFWDVMEYWDGPIHASHANCRALVPGQRHLSDEMIRELIQRGGVIGVVFYEGMLNPEWDWDDPSTRLLRASRSMSAVVEHVDHICQLAGNSDHVAIGSDLDGGFGRELAPIDLDNISDLQKFPQVLEAGGYKQEDILKISHGNLLRFFRNAWA
jgi:membrane dipeptidase